MDAADQFIHEDIRHLVQTGELRMNTGAFEPAFQSLQSTTMGEVGDLSQFPTDLLVTIDFTRTIKIDIEDLTETSLDSFQRAVQWIISVPDDGDPLLIKNLLIISPYEANALIPDIEEHGKVTLHMYSPWTNSCYEPLDELTLRYVGRDFEPDFVPRSITIQLNLFAGSLYLRSYAEYCELCDTLGLLRSPPQAGQEVCADGFITSSTGIWGLRTSPVPALSTLFMRIREKGRG